MAYELPLFWLLAIAVALGCIWALLRGRPSIALGLLFAAGSYSGLTAPTPIGGVRMEQLAIVALSATVVATRPRALGVLIRTAPLPVAGIALYVGANLASSALLAEDPPASLKIAAWLAASAVGFGLAAVIVRERGSDLGLPRWIVGAAAVQVLVAVAAVASQAAFATDWGVETNDVILGKAYGLSWEPNILAINVATALAFVVVPGGLVGIGTRMRWAMLLWLALGLGLAYSRGGMIAVLVAVAVTAAAIAWTAQRGMSAARVLLSRRVLRMVGATALALVVAVATVQVQAGLGRLGVGMTANAVITDPDLAGVPIPTEGSDDQGAGADPEPSAPVRYVGTGDTLGLRLRNIWIGATEVAERSPIIGLGTDSYRQRHTEPRCGCPAHIANLPAAAAYDSGLIGLAGLIGLLAATSWAAWRTRRWAYLTALVVLVVGYQVTDAFRFGSNWVLLGAIIGLWTVGSRTLSESRPPEPSSTPEERATQRSQGGLGGRSHSPAVPVVVAADLGGSRSSS